MRTLIALSLTLFAALAHEVAAQSAVEAVEISIRRTPCFGRCPVYDLTLRRAGAATYDGVKWTPMVGHYHAVIDSATFATLAQVLVNGRFFSLDTAYDVAATDQQTTFLCMRTAALNRCIRQYGIVPWELRRLQDSVDKVAAGLKWVKGEPR